ncbi:MAG: hypothetical protein WB443_07045 [Nitrososphaeraceae archaeon]
MSNTINYSFVSKPFIITAVILLFLGTSIGSIWMMSIFGADLPEWFHGTYGLHKILQMDGFLTLLIMGIGYMIVPRFRNIQLASVKLAYVSFILIVTSLIFGFIQTVGDNDKNFSTSIIISRLSGVTIFLAIIFWTLRIRPKLLGLSDYFITLCLLALITVNVIELSGYRHASSLTHIQLWLLFPVLMIFGIEYKTLPSFLGFIRPRKTSAIASLVFLSLCIILGLASVMFTNVLLLSIIFNVTLFASVLTFARAIYAFGGFDNREILRLIQGEKKARYNFTVIHIRVSFLFLFIGISTAILFSLVGQYFVFYDLVIHSIAIGFIGLTIALYLPLMLPPIIGKIIHFTNFNRIPLVLIIISLCIRAVGDFILAQPSSFLGHIGDSSPQIFTYSFGLSGWFVVVAMLVFVMMIHKSMKQVDPLPSSNTNLF